MIATNYAHDVVSGEKKYAEYAGKSTDEKPTIFGKERSVVNGAIVEKDIGLTTGSVFIEVDTGDAYLFDETNKSWIKVGG